MNKSLKEIIKSIIKQNRIGKEFILNHDKNLPTTFMINNLTDEILFSIIKYIKQFKQDYKKVPTDRFLLLCQERNELINEIINDLRPKRKGTNEK